MREGEERRWDWDEALGWFDRARRDTVAARALLNVELPDEAAFHIQQAVEKALKGLLAAAGEPLRKTHNLEDLAEIAHRQWPSLVEIPFPLSGVEQWYLSGRYPGDADPPPGIAELAETLEIAAQLLERAVSEAAPP